MRLNNYGEKSAAYAQHKKDEGTIMLAYKELGFLFDRYVTSGGDKALDFGSGTGTSRKYLATVGFDADGVDIDEDMIAKAQELDPEHKEQYQLITDSVIPHRASKYDLAFSSLVVLEMSSKEEIRKYFLEAYRVMKFDGTFIVLTVNDNFYTHPWVSVDTNYPGNKEAKSGDKVRIKIKEINLELDDFYWTKEDYRQIAQEVGFTILEEVQPKGTKADGVKWVSEHEHAPFVIFVMKKTKSLENKKVLLEKYGLDVCVPGRGNFTEISRDREIIKKEDLPDGYSGDRNASATIRLLMMPGDFWPFHRLKSVELFKHIEGNDLVIHCIDKHGNYSVVYLGEEHEEAVKELTVPADCWYAEEVIGSSGYCLIEAKTSPGFHPDDQEEGKREQLLSLVGPHSRELVTIIDRLNPYDKIPKKPANPVNDDSPLKIGAKESDLSSSNDLALRGPF